MENTYYQLSNGSSIFELFAAVYLALSIGGKIFSIEDKTSMSALSNFLRYAVFGNITEEADSITAALANVKGETASIIELIPKEK